MLCNRTWPFGPGPTRKGRKRPEMRPGLRRQESEAEQAYVGMVWLWGHEAGIEEWGHTFLGLSDPLSWSNSPSQQHSPESRNLRAQAGRQVARCSKMPLKLPGLHSSQLLSPSSSPKLHSSALQDLWRPPFSAPARSRCRTPGAPWPPCHRPEAGGGWLHLLDNLLLAVSL